MPKRNWKILTKKRDGATKGVPQQTLAWLTNIVSHRQLAEMRRDAFSYSNRTSLKSMETISMSRIGRLLGPSVYARLLLGK